MTTSAEKRLDANDVFLNLLEANSFNALNGKKVAAELRSNRGLWDGMLYTRSDTGITLRDLPDGSYNADTIYLLTDIIRWRKLKTLAEKWNPDFMLIITNDDTWEADRYSDEYSSYALKKVSKKDAKLRGERSLSGFLGASGADERVVIQLWWD